MSLTKTTLLVGLILCLSPFVIADEGVVQERATKEIPQAPGEDDRTFSPVTWEESRETKIGRFSEKDSRGYSTEWIRFDSTRFTRFLFNWDLPQQTRVLEERVVEDFNVAEGIPHSYVRWTAYGSNESKADEVLWTFEGKGKPDRKTGNFLKLFQEGCCDAMDSHLFIDLRTGKPVYASSFGLPFVTSGDGVTLNVAVLPTNAMHVNEVDSTKWNALGYLALGNDSKSLQSFVLWDTRNESAWPSYTEDAKVESFWRNTDEKDIKKAIGKITLYFYEISKVEIPVFRDGIHLPEDGIITGIRFEAIDRVPFEATPVPSHIFSLPDSNSKINTTEKD